jgi:N,N'-diacetyllegionaminate synthase
MAFMDNFSISSENENSRHQVLIIAEVAQAHDGSLNMAHAFIDAIAKAGADAVKFQTHIACAESTPAEPWRVKFSQQDLTRYDYWKRMEFTEIQWNGLRKHASERGLLFVSSPFSIEAVDLLARVKVEAWKIASGEVSNEQMMERMLQTQVPFIISSGMSSLEEIDSAVNRMHSASMPFCLLQCTTAYPCPPEKVGLNLLQFFHRRYGCSVGLSDHSGTIYPGFAAVALGAEVVEVHVTLSRDMPGPDVPASLTVGELTQLCKGIRYIETALSNPIDKNAIARDLKPVRELFTKSIVARSDLPAGTILCMEQLVFKKPGIGIPAAQLSQILGRRLARSVSADTLLSKDDLDDSK